MGSFVEAINRVKAVLENDADLQAFCQTQWGKALQVEVVFKHRREINVKDLPLILITRPQVRDRKIKPSARDAKHGVRLYCGFYQNDSDSSVFDQVGFEEAIDDAFIKDTSLDGLVLETIVKDSINDEGIHHPVYFTIIDLEILFRRLQA